MKRTTLFVAVASALPISLSAYANGNSGTGSQNQSEWGKTTQRVEAMHGQQGGSNRQSADLVKQVQEKLSAMGKDPGKPDGRLGPKTQQALKEYQNEKGLQATGKLDRQTLAALGIDQSGSAATGGSTSSSQSHGKGSSGSESN